MRLKGVVFGVAVFAATAAAAPAKLAVSPTQRQVGEADRHCQFALQALRTGNVAKAKSLYGKALKTFPEFPDALTGLGHVAMSERRFDEALQDFNDARHAYVSFSGALFELQLERFQHTQEQIGQLRDQIQSMEQLIATRMSSVSGNSGRLEQHILELQSQIQMLETVKAPDPASGAEPGELHFFIGNALVNLDRFDEAVEEWETCARTSPRFALVYNNLAVAYWKKGRLDRALESLARAEQLGLPVNPQFKADLERSAAERNQDVPEKIGSARITRP
jgi:tetratricopeptide (TPR) repeat protein